MSLGAIPGPSIFPQREVEQAIGANRRGSDFSGISLHSESDLDLTGRRAVIRQRSFVPLLQRQQSSDKHSAQGASQHGSAEKSASTADGGASAGGATPANAPVAASTCSPTGKKRADFLKEPNVTTDDFGLTRLDVNAVVFPAFSTKRMRGGFVIEPTTAALPAIQSVFTDADTFTEGEAHFIAQDGGECPSGKKPIRWIITSGGAAKIKQGEQEHCDDFQLAFDLSLKRYAEAVNTLAGHHVYASQAQAERAVTRIAGLAPKDWPGTFLCLARKTRLRDGSNGWHTPRPMMRPPRLDTGCDHVSAWVQASSLPKVGQHPSAEIVKDCGETGKKAGSAAGSRSVHAHARKPWVPDIDGPAWIRRKPLAEAAGSGTPASVDGVLATPGHALNATARAFMEPRFGFDFSRVRVHADAVAARSADALDAMAYTVGTHVVFAQGRYAPDTSAGLHLLAHELTHVVQQSGTGSPSRSGWQMGPVEDAFEREADRTADAVTAPGKVHPAAISASEKTLRRACGPAAIGSTSGCIGLGGQDITDVGSSSADLFTFKAGCDEFQPGEAARLRERARSMAPDETVEIHGFASEEGPASFNDDLSCARARAANSMLQRESGPLPATLFSHGATRGGRADRRSVVLAVRSNRQAQPEDCSSLVGDCEFYRCRERRHPCGATGYYLGYGYKYCERFSRLLRPRLPASGQRWLDKTKDCLQEHIDRHIPLDTPCDAVKRSAFDSHPDCYVLSGVCFLDPAQWLQIMGVIDPQDNDLKQMLSTGIDCIGNLAPVGLFPIHSLGPGGGYGGLMERDFQRNFGGRR
ncbi:MAG: eCIS core domain-containing protein [Rhodanobacter sp.]